MKLSDLLDNYSPVYPTNGDWEETFQVLHDDPHEYATVLSLIEEYKASGGFRDPIILTTHTEDAEEGEVYVPQVKDGTHRVYALHLMGVEDVYVHEGYRLPSHEDIETEDYSAYPIMETYVKIFDTLAEDEVEAAMSSLRSFKVNDGTWVTCDVACYINNILNFTWSTTLLDEEELQELSDVVVSRVNKVIPGHETKTRTFVFWNENEDNETWKEFSK